MQSIGAGTRDDLYREMVARLHRETDRLFLKLFVLQWIVAIALAVVTGPDAHEPGGLPHLPLAIVGGALLMASSLALTSARARWWGTRHAIAIAQMLWSAMLITLTEGRTETHFHVFGSIAFLAFYRDWRVLCTAIVVVTIDHVGRGVWSPASLLGDPTTAWWRALEHVGWIAFEGAVLIVACVRGARDQLAAAAREARLERTKSIIERHVQDRTTELQESVERYRALVENTEAVTFEYDVVGHRMLYVAPQASRLLDCSLDDLTDVRFFEGTLHPEDQARVRRELAQLAAGTRSWSDPIDCRLVSRRGRTVHIRTFLNAHAGSRRIRGVTVDVTRQRQLECELQQAQKLESVGRLAAGVAHEINTPIQFVGDSVQFMATAIDDVMVVLAKQHAIVGGVLAGMPTSELVRAAEEAQAAADAADLGYIAEQLPKAAERALDGAERVGTIVRSMKVFAHPDAAEMAPVDLNQAIQSTLTIARNEYRYVATVTTELGVIPPVTCFVGEINQVILNLVINATHAIADIHAQTGTRGLITVSTRATEHHVEIAIRDTGGGIADAIRDRVFDPFFTTKEVGKGTGQGLAMARAVIVERHRGSLTFDTTVGHGTTFHIRLPIDAAAQTRVAA